MYVSVGDVRLFVDVDGMQLVPDGPVLREKPTLVILHGGPGSDHSYYKPFFARLTDLCQVVYVDQRGNGRSEDGDPARWTLAQWGDDVATLCDTLGIERPIVLGHSFGGQVALSYASRHPEQPAKLIVLNARARLVRERHFAAFERLGGPEARQIAQQFLEAYSPEVREQYLRVCLPLYSRVPADPESEARVVQRLAVGEVFNNGERQSADLRADLARITCPTLMLVGADDPRTPPADAEEIVASLVNAPVTYHCLPEAGHRLTLDVPDLLEDLLRAFISSEALDLATVAALSV